MARVQLLCVRGKERVCAGGVEYIAVGCTESVLCVVMWAVLTLPSFSVPRFSDVAVRIENRVGFGRITGELSWCWCVCVCLDEGCSLVALLVKPKWSLPRADGGARNGAGHCGSNFVGGIRTEPAARPPLSSLTRKFSPVWFGLPREEKTDGERNVCVRVGEKKRVCTVYVFCVFVWPVL